MTLNNAPTGLDTATTNQVCDDTDLGSGAFVYGFQFATNGDYESALLAYNNDISFNESTAQHSCPPSQAGGQGTSTWHDNSGDTGLLECGSISGTAAGSSDPVYIWTIPSDNIIFEAIGADNSSFSTLNTWWMTDAQG
jgi:hypothetical protein